MSIKATTQARINCHYCGYDDHESETCPLKEMDRLGIMAINRAHVNCDYCGYDDHEWETCPLKEMDRLGIMAANRARINCDYCGWDDHERETCRLRELDIMSIKATTRARIKQHKNNKYHLSSFFIVSSLVFRDQDAPQYLGHALAGILAFGLMQLDGQHGLGGWRWIFILEGVITGAIALLCFVFLVDFPDRAAKSWRFLNQRECDFIVRRINQDRNDGHLEAFSLKKFLKPSLDLKIWGFALIFFCTTTVTYAIAYFLPIILREGMGFDVGESQCLVAPPYAFAGIVMYSSAWVGDKYRMRGVILIGNCLLSIVGLPMMGFATGNATRYAGVFLTVGGANSLIPSCMAYQANNVRGQWTRAFSSAPLVGFGGLGGIVSSLVFRQQDAPEYLMGMYAAIACNILIIVVVLLLSLWFWWSNRQADRGKREIEGDASFRYTI